MNIENTRRDISNDGLGGGSAWQNVKRWSGNNPRLARVVWIGLVLAAVALPIWVVYPKPVVNNRFAQSPGSAGRRRRQRR